MKSWIASGCLLAFIGTCAIANAQNPFVGSWKLNQAKSHLTGRTVKYSPANNGEIRETTAENSYTFKTDGHSYPAGFGGTDATWKQIDSSTWQAVFRRRGVMLGTDTMKVSADGKTMTDTSDGKNPDGKTFHDTEVFTRVAGEKGLMGTWKSDKVKMSSSNTLEFAANGQDGITWILPAVKGKVSTKFDGKDYAAAGPTVPSGLTLACTRTGKDSFSMIEKISGKPLFKGTYKVSADGKTLTAISTPVSVNQPETAVYDKE